MVRALWLICFLALTVAARPVAAQETRSYSNQLRRIEHPKPLLADHPKFFEPIIEQAHFEAPPIVDEPDADLHVRLGDFRTTPAALSKCPITCKPNTRR